jgi:pyridoxal phosphate enzyme (YggS family)
MGTLETNLNRVRARIGAACRRAGRSDSSVSLVAVTKTVGVPEILELARLGQCRFGENRVQDALAKHAELSGRGFEWHMIGHLQRNKVRDVLKMFSMIHSVDSERLAVEIDKEAAKQGLTVPVLIEVNVSGEATKEGLEPAAVRAVATAVSSMPHVRLAGLMTMAPLVDDAEETRPVFRRLRGLLEELRAVGLPGADLRHLSMGMTQDFEVAIEEGATLVRVGTALFR